MLGSLCRIEVPDFCVRGNNLLYTRKTVTTLSDTRTEVEVGMKIYDIGTTNETVPCRAFSPAKQVPGKQGKRPFQVAMEVLLRWWYVIVCDTWICVNI